MSDVLFDALKQLAIHVKKKVEEGISNRTITPENENWFRWKVDKFEYTDEGISLPGALGESITKPSWLRASVELRYSIIKSAEYCSALKQLTTNFGKKENLSDFLAKFVFKLIYQCLSDTKHGEIGIDAAIITFIKELREEPITYGADVELHGVVLQPERIDIAAGITLRRPKIEDLEKEFHEYSKPYSFNWPSAILNIEFLGRRADETQRRIYRAIAILRLFKVGSVKWTSYNMYSDSVADLLGRGSMFSGDRLAALETSLITLDDEPKLKRFWHKMNESIPASFFETGITKVEHETIAYNRYSDALSQNGILERRVANAIMGLEALFFKPEGEAQELAYRLRIRVSKLFGLLGYDPNEVKERINDAYKIRSIFTHGGHLDYKKKTKLEKKYKDVKNLLLPVLDYLRVSIIMAMLLPKEKEEFIDLIDDSLIDRRKEDQLSSLISGVKEFTR